MARRGNYDLLGKFSWCIPDGAGIIFLLLLLLLGTIIGLVVVGILGYFVSAEAMSDYTTLISYPIMFIPPMIWASINSRNTRYRQKGMALDNANVKPRGWAACICMAVLGTMAVAIVSDYFQTLLPPMPAWLEKAFKELLNGNILINFICVSIFAPFFEEWLCRGETRLGHSDFRFLLRSHPPESLAGNTRFPDGIALRVCLLQDRFAQAYYVDARHQQYRIAHRQQYPFLLGV